MKTKADSLIISTYSQEFFEKHVRFNFNCTAYKGKWETYRSESKNEKKSLEMLSKFELIEELRWYECSLKPIF